jgi:hypothetical protein
MGSKTKAKKVQKRNKGKKFKWNGNKDPVDGEVVQDNNLFESISNRKHNKSGDASKRTKLIEEYKNRGKTNKFRDGRMGQERINLTEDDKMKMRYLREQKEKLKAYSSNIVSKRNARYNLDDDTEGMGLMSKRQRKSDLLGSDEEDGAGFTHKGRKLEGVDDF